MRGSFCMSWRYWSNAVEGEERKKPLDLLSPVVCISPLVATLPMADLGGAPRNLLDAHVNYGRTQPSTAMFHATGGTGGSLGFVRVVAIKMAIPIRTMHPTITHVCETPTRMAAMARPMMRTMNPIR